MCRRTRAEEEEEVKDNQLSSLRDVDQTTSSKAAPCVVQTLYLDCFKRAQSNICNEFR